MEFSGYCTVVSGTEWNKIGKINRRMAWMRKR
jgi:hypothetical protein